MVKQHKYPRLLVISVLLHSLVLSLFIVSFELSSKMPVVQNSDKPEVLNATLVDQSSLQPKVIQKPLPPPPPKPMVAVAPKPLIKPAPEPEVAIAIKKPIIIPNKKPAPLQEDKIQKQLLADLKKQTERPIKNKQKEIQAAFEKEMKELKVKALQQQMLQEQKRLENIRTAQMQGVVDKYKALILQTISQHWLVPPNVDKKLVAKMLIRIAPGGSVLDVQLIKSSGDEGLDRSARAAIFKASPLPVPSDLDEFEAFRQFILKVKPENVLTTDSWMS